MNSAAGGDVIINLVDDAGKPRSLTLRPSIGFIRALDTRGIKLMALLKKFRDSEYGLTEMALVVLASCTEKLDLEDIESLLFNTGVATEGVILPIVEVITNALNGGRKAESPKGDEAGNPPK